MKNLVTRLCVWACMASALVTLVAYTVVRADDKPNQPDPRQCPTMLQLATADAQQFLGVARQNAADLAIAKDDNEKLKARIKELEADKPAKPDK